jgi:hypothetical protein
MLKLKHYRTIITSLSFGLIASLGLAQSQTTSTLSADFAKAGLKALLVIERSTGTESQSDTAAQRAASASAASALDDADVAANTPEERAVFYTIKSFSVTRIMHNMDRDIAIMQGRSDYASVYNKESDCTTLLEKILRMKQFSGIATVPSMFNGRPSALNIPACFLNK